MFDILLDSGIIQDLAGLVAIIGVFIEISPIQISPITWLLKTIGDKMNENLRDDISNLKDSFDTLDNKVDQNEIDRIRWEILEFANSCRNHKLHTKEEFLHVIDLNQKYHKIIAAKNIENGQLDLEYAYIEKLYVQCLNKNNFLCSDED